MCNHLVLGQDDALLRRDEIIDDLYVNVQILNRLKVLLSLQQFLQLRRHVVGCLGVEIRLDLLNQLIVADGFCNWRVDVLRNDVDRGLEEIDFLLGKVGRLARLSQRLQLANDLNDIMATRQRVQVAHGLRQILCIGVEHALILGDLLDDPLVELLLLLLLRHVAIVIFIFVHDLVIVVLKPGASMRLICPFGPTDTCLRFSLGVQDLGYGHVEHSIDYWLLLFHFTVDSGHRTLLDLRKLLDLPDGFLEQELEDVLIVDVEDVDELNVFQRVLLDRLQIQIKNAFAVIFRLFLDHSNAGLVVLLINRRVHGLLRKNILELLLFKILSQLL